MIETMSDGNAKKGCSRWPSKSHVVIVLNNDIFVCSDKCHYSECCTCCRDLFVASHINDSSFIIKSTCFSVPLASVTQNNAS